jgi:hypothetical protein
MTTTSATLQMDWDKVCEIMKDCKHPGQVGWKIAKLMRIPNFRVWERALDVKIGLRLVAILKQAVELRKRPNYVIFDRKGNVEAQW